MTDPAIRLSTITGVLGDALTEMHKRGEKIDDRVMRLYLDLVVDKLKTAADLDALAEKARVQKRKDGPTVEEVKDALEVIHRHKYASPND